MTCSHGPPKPDADAVDILILTHNRSYALAQCVGSIREWTRHPYRLIIQDHASEPEHREHIKRLAGPDLRIVWKQRVLSCNEGRHEGLAEIKSGFCVFLDDDFRVCEGWLASLVGTMRMHPLAAAVCANRIDDGKRKVSGARDIVGGEIRFREYGYRGSGDYVAGGCTLYRTDALRRLEFRPEYNGTSEDLDHGMQFTKELGYELWNGEPTLYHWHGGECGDGYNATRWRPHECFDSAVAMYYRWGIKTIAQHLYAKYLLQGIRLCDAHMQAIAEINAA
ncbi:MAG TPA: glycosyltransferase family 2 protein [Phycisphaerae bacterium]|nr:glycosyltransferase family 2 protein [Phycisphaerae bacterium]